VNAPLRKAGVVILVLFGLLFANLNWVQAYKADKYRNSPYNGRVQVADYSRPRGVIEADGEPLAESKATDDRLKYLRVYPDKLTYAPIIGYKPVNGAATGIEASENDFLSGNSDKLVTDRFAEMFTGDNSGGGNVVLTISTRTQETAYRELLNNQRNVGKGAAIALNPRTGAIQAMVSIPSYDPNPLASHDPKVAQAAFDKLNKDSDKPLINRAIGETVPPGSTFKTIVTAAALQNGYNEETQIPAGSVYRHNGAVIRNAEEETCPGSEISLKEALTESCNTGYAQLGVALGADKIKKAAQAFGFEQSDLTVGDLQGGGLPVAASHTGSIANADGSTDQGALAQSSIGQRDVRMTPLQGALIASTVAFGGQQMRPYLVQRLLSSDRSQLYSANPKVLRNPVDSTVAAAMKDMMISVVENGTGKRAQISGMTVGGKTGTAQNAEGADPHGWFIGFALDKSGQPVSAVCVMLENVPGGHASAEAARIAGKIMAAAAGRGGD
jgi:peptidoglycan glycosyltransferase